MQLIVINATFPIEYTIIQLINIKISKIIQVHEN